MAEKPKEKVGYKNPPRWTRFKLGQSGNPQGRPKGSKNMRTLLEEELMQEVTVTENGKSYKITKGRVVVKRTAEQAMQGSERSQELIFKVTGPAKTDASDAVPFSDARDQALIERYGSKQNGKTNK